MVLPSLRICRLRFSDTDTTALVPGRTQDLDATRYAMENGLPWKPSGQDEEVEGLIATYMHPSACARAVGGNVDEEQVEGIIRSYMPMTPSSLPSTGPPVGSPL